MVVAAMAVIVVVAWRAAVGIGMQHRADRRPACDGRMGVITMVVTAVVVAAVPMPARAVRAIGAVLRLEGLLGLAHDQVHGAQHGGEHVVGLDLQVRRRQLDGHVAVAEVVGRARQVEGRAVLRARRDDQHRLRRGDHPDQRAVLDDQDVAAPHRGAARQEHPEVPALRIGGVEAAFLAHVPVEFDDGGAFEQHGGEAAAARHEFVDVEHGVECARPGTRVPARGQNRK
jgi:hypothetical protein